MIKRIFKRFKKFLTLKIHGINYYLRKQGATVGDNCYLYSDLSTTETYLISIGDNTTVSNDVQFITHDNSVCKVIEGATDVFGKITVGRNVFIGAHSILMPGVTIPDNTIIAAGSVVVKSPQESGLIIGGNPARTIGNINDYKERMRDYAINIEGLSAKEKKKLICSSKLLEK